MQRQSNDRGSYLFGRGKSAFFETESSAIIWVKMHRLIMNGGFNTFQGQTSLDIVSMRWRHPDHEHVIGVPRVRHHFRKIQTGNTAEGIIIIMIQLFSVG